MKKYLNRLSTRKERGRNTKNTIPQRRGISENPKKNAEDADVQEEESSASMDSTTVDNASVKSQKN